MLSKTNIQEKLHKTRSKRISPEAILNEVILIFSEVDAERKAIEQRVSTKNKGNFPKLDFNCLDNKNIYHLNDIKNLCITYRLRFLDSNLFRGNIPEEAITKIREFENKHTIILDVLKIVAPAKLMRLENADDPLLFTALGNDYYYLLHKWGNDLHPFRKFIMWPYKCFENLVFTVFCISIILTLITPIHLLSKTEGMQEYVLLFLFIFKGVAGMVLYYGFAKGKNFNNAIWDSKYYNA